MKKKYTVILLLLLSLCNLFGHPYKPAHYVIIDTDGGIDDMRALCMLLATPDIRVLGITVSPGVLTPENTYKKVKSLLFKLHNQGIPVGLNRLDIKGMDCKKALQMQWGAEIDFQDSTALSGIELVNSIFAHSTDPIAFICLASLQPIEHYTQHIMDFTKKAQRVIWSNDQINPLEGFNHELSPYSFEKLSNLNLKLEVVNGNTPQENFYTPALLEIIHKISTPYAILFNSGFMEIGSEEIKCFDELIAVYLHYPELFRADTLEKVTFYKISEVSNTRLNTAFQNILAGETLAMFQVLKTIPLDSSAYSEDMRPIINETIKKYGKSEWYAGVIANELHRHLGVYAIVGVKMGIRAMEYFGAGIDEISVITYAGLIPPYSCMNDGLQVSTGATLGHGLISVSTDSLIYPAADFTYMGRTIRVILREEISKKIAAEVKQLNFIHGLDSDIYWELVRKLAIKYWASFDRHEVFKITELN